MIWIGMFGGLMTLLAIAAAIAVGYREAEEEQLELLETRAERLYRLADAADELRAELGREPSVREIYEAAARLDPEDAATGVEEPSDVASSDVVSTDPASTDPASSDPVIDLRRRVSLIVSGTEPDDVTTAAG